MKHTNLEFGAADPADGGQFVMKEKVVGFVVESPLTDGESGAAVFDLFDHRLESFPLVVAQQLEIFRRFNVQLMLGLRLGWLEGAGENSDLRILQLL